MTRYAVVHTAFAGNDIFADVPDIGGDVEVYIGLPWPAATADDTYWVAHRDANEVKAMLERDGYTVIDFDTAYIAPYSELNPSGKWIEASAPLPPPAG